MSKQQATALTKEGLFYMFLLAFQFGLQPLLTKTYTPKSMNKSIIVLLQESVKFVLGLTMLLFTNQLSNATKNWTLMSWIQVALLPAFLYSIQNICALMAYQNLDSLTFTVLNQTKTLSAALCCYLIIGKPQSKLQVLALLILLTSALVIEKIIPLDLQFDLSNNSTSSSEISNQRFMQGVVPILIASFISGLAGAISQKNLQGANGRNSILFSMELCIASILFLALKLFQENIELQSVKSEMTVQMFIPIIVNAIGGILVGLVTKYAGSVRKGFALIFGLLISGLAQQFIVGGKDSGVEVEQIVGGILAGFSLWLHSSFPYKITSTSVDSSSISKSATNNGPSDTDKKKKKKKSVKEE